MSGVTLDAIDRRILDTLQEDSSLTNVKLAEKVGLSPSPCLRRVRILEEAGIIERYVAVLDHEAVGLGMTAFIEVRLDSKKHRDVEEFETAVARLPEVLECHIVAGDYDYLLRVVLSDMTRFRQFIMNRVLEMPNIASTRSSFSVGEVKRTTKLPLPPIS
jgi:Lrp/AsnC family transcriptional regulator, leucine-responsive regulatory protein